MNKINKTFILIFMAVIWRRVWILTAIYCRCKKLPIEKSHIGKVLNYTMYFDSGLANELKPYILKALEDGFLMPHFHRDNIYATRAINMFASGYDIVVKHKPQKEFIIDYALSVFDDDNIDQLKNEREDILVKFDNTIKLCRVIDDWNIDYRLLYSDDNYKNIMIEFLMNL